MPKLSDTFHVGNLEVAALSDGAPERTLAGFFHEVDEEDWTRALGITSAEQPVPFNFGSFLIRGGTRTVLVDTGYGPPASEMEMEGGAGLLDRIADLGVALEDIDIVVHTHLHGDHCGWNLDADGQPTFPKAIFFVSRVEMDYWLGSQADANPMAVAARRAVTSLRDSGRVATFDDEIDVTTGITTVPTPGHTPGHTSLLLTSQGEHLLIAGDAAHHPAHFEHHDWIPAVDLDREESQRSRQKLAALAVERDAIVTGGHFPILTLGKIERVETGYRWRQL